jgi:hypothetical protein
MLSGRTLQILACLVIPSMAFLQDPGNQEARRKIAELGV